MPAPRRRAVVCLIAVAGLVLAACGESDEDRAPVLDTSPPATAAPDGDDTAAAGDPAATSAPVETSPDKPGVSIPDELPTELVITDLVEGEGEAAEEGDTVTVDYVGVRSADGTEFDNSYDRGQPFTVTLGAGQVIPGWDQGLVGVKVGGRRQLDIPADLAYGDSGAGGVIQPGDALTFVVDVVDIEFAPPPPTLAPQADASECPATDGSQEQVQQFDEYPPTCIDPSATYTAEIVTNKGSLTVELYADRAPITVNNFVTLARYKYFDGTECHRIIPGFVVQCGDPTATGTGGPGYDFPDELPEAGEYQIGSLAMANAGPDTNGSQFFIITGDQGVALPPAYSLFGMVTEGLDTTLVDLDAAGNPDGGVPPLEDVVIESVTITES
jgi:cyclophilin family peptidyl-prolyl cis-trans isomerase/FKBP-type peptidyl-prolyl cis-trans isomerase